MTTARSFIRLCTSSVNARTVQRSLPGHIAIRRAFPAVGRQAYSTSPSDPASTSAPVPPDASMPGSNPPNGIRDAKEGGQQFKRSRFKPIHIFMGVTGIGLLFTFYGLLEFYFALPTWPETVRDPLRKALRARNMGDYDRSEGFFKEAIAAALALPASEFDPDPLLKLSGVYITYSTALEESKNKRGAYIALLEGFRHFGSAPLSTKTAERISGDWAENRLLTSEDHIRAIGLAQKLGHLALQLSAAPTITLYPSSFEGGLDGVGSWLDAAERHLGDALTAMLHLGLSAPSGSNKVIAGRDVSLPGDNKEPLKSEEIVMDEVTGGSVDKRGLGVTMEALAEIYARKGEYAIAGNLLIQAISTLLPPKSEAAPPITDQCQAAMLMTTISSHALQPLTPKAIKASKSWSLRALQIADEAIKSSASSSSPGDSGTNTLICRKALAVGSYNLGMLAEMDGDLDVSLQHLNLALRVSRDIGFAEGKRQAADAIARVRALNSTSKS